MSRLETTLRSALETTARRATSMLKLDQVPGGATSAAQLTFAGDELTAVNQSMYEYVSRHPDDTHAVASTAIDRVRFARSVEWLRSVIRPGQRVLELGGGGMSTHIITRAFPGVPVEAAPFELRRPFPHSDASFDVVLCMEVIEHVADEPYQYATTLSGVRHCLREVARVLAPGGRLFLTTPNAASTFTLARAVKQEPQMAYEWHFREFTAGEISGLVTEQAFAIERAGTEQVWFFSPRNPLLLMALWAAGADLKNRGDDTFLIARRT